MLHIYGIYALIHSFIHLPVFVTLGTMGGAGDLTLNRKIHGSYLHGWAFFLVTFIKEDLYSLNISCFYPFCLTAEKP